MALPLIESSIHKFIFSPSRFRHLQTVGPGQATEPNTLFILDSSFNPPSIAHMSLATNAVKQSALTYKRPYRLVLLFSTHNADKTADQAAFAQRIAMVTLFAQDLSDQLKKSAKDAGKNNSDEAVPIDIALTKSPYFTDKSTAISKADPTQYLNDPTHVHLVGYDTLIRIVAPRYYPDHSPPLSALAPLFSPGHRLLVTVRPTTLSDKSSEKFGTMEEQWKYLDMLKSGGMEEQGLKKEWAEQIDMVEGAKDNAEGISSTRIREAVAAKDWKEVQALCTPSVAGWLYEFKDGKT